MTKSFRDQDIGELFNDILVPRFRTIERPARRKLLYLHRARRLEDFKAPPGNRLELLRGDRKAIEKINTAFESMRNGVFVSDGTKAMLTMLKLRMTTEVRNGQEAA